ncbi:MAG: hypothetical protein JO131_04705 [Gammaproteobacteria bacterium]|nr:hypothetical protein [Gammaproteobacteria bacterium]
MKRFILLGIMLITFISSCNTIKGTANGFNKDMDNLTGNNHKTTTTTTTTYHNTNTNSSTTSS